MPQSKPQLVRVSETMRAPITFHLDGVELGALVGDTVLTAILNNQRYLRHADFSGEPRAGFCLMGACQDCWVRCEDGTRLRACSTPMRAGLRLITNNTVDSAGGAQ
jgi:hypothetical protein